MLVADTVNHALRGVDLRTGTARTVAGDGRQWMQGDGTDRLSSPWDVAWWQDRAWIAMAGIHQLWTFDPRTGEVDAVAGTTHEGLVDGPVAEAWFAQPSGLAADGDRLWVADAETSALRVVEDGAVSTVVGHGLFDFGFRDGDRETARLQHPLGVAVLPDGAVAVADTYNGAVRRFDPATGLLSTLATGLEEPSDVVVSGDRLLVVESAAARGHRAAPRRPAPTRSSPRPPRARSPRSAPRSPSTSRSCHRPARRSTTGSARPPSWWSARPRRR